MARCQQLYALWSKRDGTWGYARALDSAMGLEHRWKGGCAAGVALLKRALERAQVPVPPVESAARQ